MKKIDIIEACIDCSRVNYNAPRDRFYCTLSKNKSIKNEGSIPIWCKLMDSYPATAATAVFTDSTPQMFIHKM